MNTEKTVDGLPLSELKKRCSRCGEEKPTSAFNRNKVKRDGYQAHCRECCKNYRLSNLDKVRQLDRERSKKRWLENPEYQQQHRTWNKKKYEKNYDPEKQRERRLKSAYGITQSEYDKLLEEQGGFCICGSDNNGKNLVVDHDHETGEVRGLLCNGCNTILGMAHDDTVVLTRLIDYLHGIYRIRKLFGLPVEYPSVKLQNMELQ